MPRDHIATLHSLAYHALGSPKVAERGALLRQWNEEQRAFQIDGGAAIDLEDGYTPQNQGNDALGLYNLARMLMLPKGHILWHRCEAFSKRWEDFKQQTGSMDFADLITHAINDLPRCSLDPGVMVLDEAQDTSPALLALFRKWSGHCEEALVAGDPAQVLFSWIGASPAHLLEPLPPEQTRLLHQSYRLPRRVQDHAERWLSLHSGGMMAGREYRPTEREGQVTHEWATWQEPEEIAAMVRQRLDRWEPQAGATTDAPKYDVMVLATCAYMLTPIVAALRSAGIPFSNVYRMTNGAWNPLGAKREGEIRAVDRLLAFLRPDSDVWGKQSRDWTSSEVAQWAAMLRADAFIKRGMKQRLIDGLGKEHVSPSDLFGYFDEENFMEMALLSHEWLASHATKAAEGPLAYASGLLREGGPMALGVAPRVAVGTVHSVKGGEARCVIIVPDLSWAAATERASGEEGWDASVRVGYVALTRSSEEVVLCSPAGPPERRAPSLW